jgi:hypothetical protein
MPSWNKALTVRQPITQLYYFHKNDGSADMLAVSQKQINKVSDGNLTPTTGSLATDRAKFLTYKTRNIEDAVLIADGGRLKVYDGTSINVVTPHITTDGTGGTPLETTDPGLNDLGNLTNFRTFALKKDRLFVAAHPTVKNRVSFCYFDPYLGYAVYDYFPAIYFFDVGVEDNDEIVELKVFRNVLIILCKRSAWALKGDGATLADFELIKINVPKGCVSAGSVCEVGNNLFYLGNDHIYSLFSAEQEYISAQIMSNNIQPILKSIGKADKESAISIFFDNKYYLTFPSGLTLVYDISVEAWSKYTNIYANSYLIVDGDLYFSSNDGYIYKFDENKFSDDGDPISFVMKTKVIDFDLPVQVKKMRRMWLIQKQWQGYETSFDLHMTVDQYSLIDVKDLGNETNEGLGGVWDESSWDDALWDFSEVAQHEMKLRKKGKSLQIQVSNSQVDQPVSIHGISIEYQIKKP